MKQSNESQQEYDDRLADFANRALSRHIDTAESNMDDELRGLEETVLFLTKTMPQEPVASSTLKRLKSDFIIRSQSLHVKEQKKTSWLTGFLDRMTKMEINPNLVLTVGSMAVFAGIVLVVSFTNGQQTGGPLMGTAGGSQSPGISIAAGIMVIIIILLMLRKK